MKGRLFVAALAAVSLAACGGKRELSGPRSTLVEKDGTFTIAVDDGKQIVFFPLPKPPYALVGGAWVPVTTASAGGEVMIMPRCVCGLPDCDKFCRPLAAAPPPPPQVPVDPRLQAPTPAAP